MRAAQTTRLVCREAFKFFFEEDVDPMSVSEVMRLRPRPDVVIYESER